MNKKGEFITLSIILAIIILLGLIFIDRIGKIEAKVTYVGDESEKIAYHILTENPKCDFDKVSINRESIVYFKNKDEIPKEYRIDVNCD